MLAGDRYISAALDKKLASGLGAAAGWPLHEVLSGREFEVVRMLAAGKTVSQIAEELHLSVTTVSTYRTRVMEKMNMSTTAELMHYALHNGLID